MTWCWPLGYPPHWELESMSSSLDPGCTFVTFLSTRIEWKWSHVASEARLEKCHASLPWPLAFGTSYHAEWQPSNMKRSHVRFCPTASTRTLADGQEQVPDKRAGVWWFYPQAIKHLPATPAFESPSLVPQKLNMVFSTKTCPNWRLVSKMMIFLF